MTAIVTAFISKTWPYVLSAVAGAVMASFMAYPIGHAFGVSQGRSIERADALQHSMEVIRERSETNAKINDLGDAELCSAIGGVMSNGVCN